MTQQEINDHFVKIIPMLEGIVKGIAYKSNKKIDTHAAINEAYIYIWERPDLMTDPNMLQRIAINFIKKSIHWSTSKLNKLENVNNLNEVFFNDDLDDDSDMDDKIQLEKWYTDRKCILEMYRKQEVDKVKLIIFDLYYNKGITKGVDLAKHLGINKDYSCRYIREMKADIKKFAKDNNYEITD